MHQTVPTGVIEAEWDLTHEVPLTTLNTSGFRTPTGVAHQPDSRTVWLPVEVVYPADYLPRFPQLLGVRSAYVPVVDDAGETLKLQLRFIDADFSEEKVREALVWEMKRQVRHKLQETDWYVTRKVETGEEIPQDVADARARLRQVSQDIEGEIAELEPDELAIFDYNLVGRLTAPEDGNDAVAG